MLYYLFRYLKEFGFTGANMWQYISFRALLTLVLSLVISMWFGQYFIKWMKARGAHEEQRDASIDPYGVEKKGVPTMGGIIILVAILVPCLLLGRLRNIYMLLMLFTTVWLGALGFLDDYIKMKKSKDGLRPIYKLIGQAILGLTVGIVLWQSPDAVIYENVNQTKIESGVIITEEGSQAIVGEVSNQAATDNAQLITEKSEPVKSTTTTIPFVKNNNLSYTDIMSFLGDYKRIGGWILFVLITTLAVMGVSNGSNLNDGMDGMCAGNSAIMGVALGILAYVSSHIGMASYLNIMYIPGSEELVVFACAFVGALIGFLWYNSYPAQVFMGDTGSLAIGGIIAVFAVIIHKELLLPILCFVFVAESLSVMLQTKYAKMGNKRGEKWRVFKRAPLHDTFRVKPGQLPDNFKVLINWPKGCWLESKITSRFWIVTVILAALTIVTLKVR